MVDMSHRHTVDAKGIQDELAMERKLVLKYQEELEEARKTFVEKECSFDGNNIRGRLNCKLGTMSNFCEILVTTRKRK